MEVEDKFYLRVIKWIKLGADSGDADAQHTLGVMHYYGHGVKQEFKEGMMLWFKMAARQSQLWDQE